MIGEHNLGMLLSCYYHSWHYKKQTNKHIKQNTVEF